MPLVRSENIRKSPLGLLLFVSVLFLIDSCAVSQAQAPIYPVTTPISISSIGGVTSGFAVGDFKGNGELDLAYTSASNLYIDLDVTGSSPTLLTTSLSCAPSADTAGTPVLGDVNNDGKLDVVLSCQDYVVVLLGNGDGTFQSPAYYPVSTSSAPALVDLNGDEYLDLAVFTAGVSGPQITVLLNDGSSSPGTFAAPVNYPAGASALNNEVLAGGDFNGDGKQDVIASTANGFILFFGNGDGTLQAATIQSVIPGNYALSFTTGDFNQDGITDVAFLPSIPASSITGPNPQILLGSSSGKLTQGATLPSIGSLLTGNNIQIAITSAVLTNSGTLDLIVGGDCTSIIFHGDGKGNFTQTGSYAVNGLPFAFDINGDGKPDLLLVDQSESDLFTLIGNGDGTFQGVPSTPVNIPVAFLPADFNNDGIADAAFITRQSSGQSVISVDVGRGDGTFAPLDQTIPTSGSILLSGDFNGDGKADLIAISAGDDNAPTQDSQLFFYAGNGNGTFKSAGPAFDLGVIAAYSVVAGDFNGDGKLDLVVAFGTSSVNGLAFVPGNGDGTFGTPVLFASVADDDSANGALFTADLNQDGKLDLIWPGQQGAVFLGNGNGTFKQIPLGTTYESICAIADMNGDGYPDLITCGSPSYIYAGNGDGTFQTAPFYVAPIPDYYSAESAAVGDVNNDGNPDLVIYYYYSGLSMPTGPSQLFVAYGNGKGAFTQDTNTYYAGYTVAFGRPGLVLTRLNNNAPALSSDHTLDALVFSGVGLTGMLNQENPAPSAPPVLTSSMTLQSSATSANENASITLTATVLGTNPTGNVAFSANGTALGTAALSNGTATLQTSFASVGTYAVTASYPGDENNSASTSNAVSITVAAPDFTVASNPTSATITAGQTATFSLTVTPVGGYAGTVNLSCGSLPSEATCTFSPSAVTPVNGSPATSTLTIATTAAVAALRTPPAGSQLPWIPAGSLALAGAVGLLISPRRLTRWNRRLWMLASAVLLSGAWFSLTGCSSSSTSNTTKNPGTPSGAYTVTVNLSDAAGGPTHTLTLQVTIQ